MHTRDFSKCLKKVGLIKNYLFSMFTDSTVDYVIDNTVSNSYTMIQACNKKILNYSMKIKIGMPKMVLALSYKTVAQKFDTSMNSTNGLCNFTKLSDK